MRSSTCASLSLQRRKRMVDEGRDQWLGPVWIWHRRCTEEAVKHGWGSVFREEMIRSQGKDCWPDHHAKGWGQLHFGPLTTRWRCGEGGMLMTDRLRDQWWELCVRGGGWLTGGQGPIDAAVGVTERSSGTSGWRGEGVSHSHVWLFVTPRTVASLALLSMGFSRARTLEWVAMPSSLRSSPPRDRTWVSGIAGRFFTHWAIREAQHKRESLGYKARAVWTRLRRLGDEVRYQWLGLWGQGWRGLRFTWAESVHLHSHLYKKERQC